MSAGDFETSIEYGLSLSKRLYYGKDETRPPAPQTISRTLSSKSDKSTGTTGFPPPAAYLPSSVTAYAVVAQPEVVDNPDVPSYQPYVHGRCDPPALIPLHVCGVSLDVDCFLDHATVCFNGAWRVHCIKSCGKCDCRVAVPLGEQGSILGVEIDMAGKSLYQSQLVTAEDAKEKEKVGRRGDSYFLKGSIFTFKIPQVEGGSKISIKVTWSQKLVQKDGEFCLNVPFIFPEYVNPVGKRVTKREKIVLNVNSCTGTEILCKSSSHALKELNRGVGKMSFIHEAIVRNWSTSDFNFSYAVSSTNISGGLLLYSPLLRDFDERQMFCLYLFPGNKQRVTTFRKEVVFMIDMSGSMAGVPLESTKNIVVASLHKLNVEDCFNIIAFNGEFYSFSKLMEQATHEAILKAITWLNNTLVAGGSTDIMPPLKQAMKLVAETTNAVPLIFLVTDGSVEDEREICKFVKESATGGGSISPRICTFGIGTYCNHYFLRTLAQIGRGHFDFAYDADLVGFRLQQFFATTLSMILANITVDVFGDLDSLELFPSDIPDLSCGSPLIISGKYNGKFPDSARIMGILGDKSNFSIDLKAVKTKDVPLNKVLARRQIDMLTANAWFAESKDLEEKIALAIQYLEYGGFNSQIQVANTSMKTGFPSEYTCMILLQNAPEITIKQEALKGIDKINPLKRTDTLREKIVVLGSLGVGFGNLIATAKNIPPGTELPKPADATELLVMAASNCCSRVADRVCCPCFIKTCTYMNDQCAIVLSQLCGALACFECLNCCYDLWG